MFNMKTIIAVAMLSSLASAGPLAYGICQTGCNAVVVACYAAAGATFGTGRYEIVVEYFISNNRLFQ